MKKDTIYHLCMWHQHKFTCNKSTKNSEQNISRSKCILNVYVKTTQNMAYKLNNQQKTPTKYVYHVKQCEKPSGRCSTAM